MTRLKRKIEVEEFVSEYMHCVVKGYNRQVLADRLSVQVRSVLSRANKLRRLGVKLPPLPLRMNNSITERAKKELAKFKGMKPAKPFKAPRRFANS